MLTNHCILIISPEPWNHIFVSKHHYAIELAKRGNMVFFLNPPSSTLKVKIEVIPTDNEGVSQVDYTVPVKGLRFAPRFFINYIERKFLKSLEEKINRKFDIIWNFENSRFYDFGFADTKTLKIYHQVDLNQDFHPIRVAKTADFVFAVNDSIKDFLAPYNLVTKIPHGFSGKLTNAAEKVLNQGLPPLRKNTRLQAYYVGNLDSKYLNYELLETLIIENPNVDFNLIGPYTTPNFNHLSKFAHVKFWGRRLPQEIMGLLDDADLLLLLYKVESFPDQLTSSHKILEYLASGKAVVSTHLGEFEDKRHLLYMANRSSEIPKIFKKCVETIDEVNAVHKMQERIRFAWENTYTKHLTEIEMLLDKKSNWFKLYF